VPTRTSRRRQEARTRRLGNHQRWQQRPGSARRLVDAPTGSTNDRVDAACAEHTAVREGFGALNSATRAEPNRARSRDARTNEVTRTNEDVHATCSSDDEDTHATKTIADAPTVTH
jgi:hypothetical protein